MFEIPSVVLIGGIWKTGKTDFALYISEKLMKIPSWKDPRMTIISQCASNIDTEGTFPQITDLISLKRWLYETKQNKLFILDEANVHLMSRRAMSKKNVEIIRLLGEVSKAHARMIVIAQELTKVDKEFLNPTWVRGVFIKQGLKKAQLISHLVTHDFTFLQIPKTSIPFDPYSVAPLTEEPPPELLFKDEDLSKLWQWSTTEASMFDLGFKHPQTFNRWVKKQTGKLLELLTSQLHTQ